MTGDDHSTAAPKDILWMLKARTQADVIRDQESWGTQKTIKDCNGGQDVETGDNDR